MAQQTFDVLLEKAEGMQSAFITIPFDVREVYGTRGQVKVRGTIDGYPFRSSIAPLGGGRHYMVIKKEIRQAIGKEAGDTVKVIMEQDTEPRIVDLPDDVRLLLEQNPAANERFQRLAYSHQKEYVDWITEAKKAETRAARLHKMLASLLEN